MIEVARQTYPDRGTLMRDLAELVADQLRAALASKGHATLAVPGGTTPGPFLAALSEADLAFLRLYFDEVLAKSSAQLDHACNDRLRRLFEVGGDEELVTRPEFHLVQLESLVLAERPRLLPPAPM